MSDPLTVSVMEFFKHWDEADEWLLTEHRDGGSFVINVKKDGVISHYTTAPPAYMSDPDYYKFIFGVDERLDGSNDHVRALEHIARNNPPVQGVTYE